MADKVYIALGSNLGDRRANLNRAVELLRAHPDIQVVEVSSYHETEPVDCPPGSGRFLNGAAELRTGLGPRDLLLELLRIEEQLGRVRAQPNAPRPIDLDLLLYGKEIINETEAPFLIAPHPRMHSRRFVLAPLAEIAPYAVHPEQKRTVLQMLDSINPVRNILTGKRTLVTGSTGGIGRAIVQLLAAAGANVIVHGRRSRERAEEVGRQCSIYGSEAKVLMADLREAKERDELANKAWELHGGLDILINNAGADTLTGEAAQWSFERKLAELWAVDVQATIFLSRTLGERMKEGPGGTILNMGWDQAETGMEGESGQLFGTIKGAIMAFTRSLALSLAPRVRVNCIAPGWIKTAWGDTASDYWQRRAVAETPLGRWGTPEDVARAALWLVSPQASFITGQVIRVNGGAVRA